jgi:hypothetical protein
MSQINPSEAKTFLVFARVKHIRENVFYSACRNTGCKGKKLGPGDTCPNCRNVEANPDIRYSVLIELLDHTRTLYATAFGEVGAQLFGCSADDLSSKQQVNREEFEMKIQTPILKFFRFKIRARADTFKPLNNNVVQSITDNNNPNPSLRFYATIMHLEALGTFTEASSALLKQLTISMALSSSSQQGEHKLDEEDVAGINSNVNIVPFIASPINSPIKASPQTTPSHVINNINPRNNNNNNNINNNSRMPLWISDKPHASNINSSPSSHPVSSNNNVHHNNNNNNLTPVKYSNNNNNNNNNHNNPNYNNNNNIQSNHNNNNQWKSPSNHPPPPPLSPQSPPPAGQRLQANQNQNNNAFNSPPAVHHNNQLKPPTVVPSPSPSLSMNFANNQSTPIKAGNGSNNANSNNINSSHGLGNQGNGVNQMNRNFQNNVNGNQQAFNRGVLRTPNGNQ